MHRGSWYQLGDTRTRPNKVSIIVKASKHQAFQPNHKKPYGVKLFNMMNVSTHMKFVGTFFKGRIT